MFTSLVSSVVTHVFVFYLNTNLSVAPNVVFMLFRVYFSYLVDQSFCIGRKGRWRRWLCWHLAKMSVSLRSLSRVWTSWLPRCMRKPQGSKRCVAQTAARPSTYMKRETLNAPHTYVENVCICGLGDVMSVPSFSLLCNMPGRKSPTPPHYPNQVQYYTNLSRTYLSLPSLT